MVTQVELGGAGKARSTTAGPDGQIVVAIKGVDVYDPTAGQIRNSSTDDIACWFLDTDHNGESFFVRHAYFTGADEPYDKLKRALRAEIDEGAWSSLYSTVSRAFEAPASGKIAVKMINHYGDEVLKVFEPPTLRISVSTFTLAAECPFRWMRAEGARRAGVDQRSVRS